MGNLLFGIPVILLGLFFIASPETAWHLEHGWKFKDVEPSERGVKAYRVAGFIVIFIGIIVIIFGN